MNLWVLTPSPLLGLGWRVMSCLMGNSCFGVPAQVILGKLGQRQCAALCDLGRGPDGAERGRTWLAHGNQETVSPALVLDAQILSHVQLSRCVLSM